MSTSPVALDKTPAPPPEVTGQMGGGQHAALAQIVQAIRAKAQQGAAPGATGTPAPPPPDPNGAFLAGQALIEKTITDMAGMKPGFAPWGQRIVSLMRAGVAESVGSGPATGQEPPPSSPATGSAPFAGAQKAPDEAKGFPG